MQNPASILMRPLTKQNLLSRSFSALAPLKSFSIPQSVFSSVEPERNPRWKTERYELTTSLGTGMFAEVFKAVDKHLNRTVAVKVLNRGRNQDLLVHQELNFMRALGSSVPWYRRNHFSLSTDFYQDEDKSYIVFPCHEAGDLFDECVNHGVLSESDAKIVISRMAQALDSLHSQGMIHRDVKLENIFVDKHDSRYSRLNSIALADFGYGRKVEDKDDFQNPAGTLGYVAPEILSAKQYSSACDIWSLGVCLFTSLAGYQPFPHRSDLPERASSTVIIKRELEAIKYGTAPKAWTYELDREEFKHVSVEGKRMIRRMLEVNPSRRPSASEILDSGWLRDVTI